MDMVGEMPKDQKKNDTFNIVSVGRSHWIKGYSYALDAMKILKQKGIEIKYQIIGGAGNIEIMYQLVDNNIDDVVTLLPNRSHEDVLKTISNADLLLLSSTEEGLANVAIEAMSLETLVLSTNCGGMPELIENNVTGFLVPISDPQAIASAVEKIMALSEEECKPILLKAKEKVDSQHSAAIMKSAMLNLYAQVLEKDN